jgi:hypothetical protein
MQLIPPKLLEAIAAICDILKIKNKILGLDCPTRWNSTWEIISTIIDMKPALPELLRRIRERHDGYNGFSISPDSELAKDIDPMTRSALEDFWSFLKAFKDKTLLMSASEYPTLGLVVPVYFLIKKHVQKAVDSTNGFSTTHMMSFALAVKKTLGEYNEVIKQKPITLAASLNPGIKSFLGHIGINTDQIKKDLVEEWCSKVLTP